MAYIEFKDLNKNFGDNHVLKNINLGIEKGQLVTLLGPSGCGKSTLLRCLAGLEQVTSGQVFLDGQDITNVSARERGIGMVFQQYSLFPNMSVAANVAFGLKMKKVPKEEITAKVKDILEIVGLSDKIDQFPMQLSGGQQQRVALARAIVTEPKVLLLDEPLSAIDALLRHNLQIEIRRIQQKLNITTIFVTHDQDEAMVISDTIHLLHDGIVEQSGSPTDLYSKPATKFAATFIGNYNIFSAEEFGKACGEKIDCKDVAIRPEIVEMSRQPSADSNCYHLKGKICGHISHGNIIRFSAQCGEIRVNSDVLFESEMAFAEGDEVCLSISKPLVIHLN
ncbi:MAG: ABC transporter ATP-binding protein [Lachnospiraceae bacterium]|jgi:putative spermidine/putrescine transport system ATP-binding protein|nr:ABC transporter ATP-binding protein [Lachnospiraceae bacterium]MCI1727277.1 ABC transporter ATP-binding protein [Lachnospiraceae bacterium]